MEVGSGCDGQVRPWVGAGMWSQGAWPRQGWLVCLDLSKSRTEQGQWSIDMNYAAAMLYSHPNLSHSCSTAQQKTDIIVNVSPLKVIISLEIFCSFMKYFKRKYNWTICIHTGGRCILDALRLFSLQLSIILRTDVVDNTKNWKIKKKILASFTFLHLVIIILEYIHWRPLSCWRVWKVTFSPGFCYSRKVLSLLAVCAFCQ